MLTVGGFPLVLDTTRAAAPGWSTPATATSTSTCSRFFASAPLGMNHPALADDPDVPGRAGRGRRQQAGQLRHLHRRTAREFVETFARVLGDPALPHLFFIEGGALAVENALKVAFDWKSRRNEAHGRSPRPRHQGAAPAQGLPRPQRLHPVADQHRPGQDRPLPQVRLAAHRRAGRRFPLDEHRRRGRGRRGAAPASRRARRSRRTRTTSPASSPSRSRARAATTTCGPEFLQADAGSCATSTTRCSSSTRCRPACGLTGTPWAYQQLGLRARHRRVRQEGAGLRHHGRRPRRRGARQRLPRRRPDQLHLGRRPHRHGALAAACSRSSSGTA